MAEKAMATQSCTLAWRTPWMEEPGRLQSTGSLSRTWLRDFTFTFHFHALEKEMATYSSVLDWRIPGTEEPGELLSMGSHRVGHDWRNLPAAAAASMIIHVSVLSWISDPVESPDSSSPDSYLTTTTHDIPRKNYLSLFSQKTYYRKTAKCF